jgi:23S rRNA (cytosine1962-C5)-methyltransferase
MGYNLRKKRKSNPKLPSAMEYKLLDSGEQERLEQFGEVILIRPAAQALWRRCLPKTAWEEAHARFLRDEINHWQVYKPIAETWDILLEGVRLRLKRTDFGHLGVFPEHARLWSWMYTHPLKGARVLNLFAYSGAATLALAAQGAEVTHLDAAKGMVQWAKENAALNGLEKAPIRWLVDDVRKYLARAQRRQERYDAILLDPPSFGRGKSGEVFKIEHDLSPILHACRSLLSPRPLFVLLTCHTPGYTPLAMKQVLQESFAPGSIEAGEMFIKSTFNLPCGTFATWTP